MIALTSPHRGPVTQYYGNRQPDGLQHTGNDYGYTDGSRTYPEVYAAADGEVLYAGDSRNLGWPNPWYFNPDFDRNDAVDSSAGNVLVLGHWFGVTTYSHLESWEVRAGRVTAGQHVATTGTTGRSTGKHLHFELLLYPLNFDTPTYGRTDPNAYMDGLAAMGTVTTLEDDDMCFTPEEKAHILSVLGSLADHAATKDFVLDNVDGAGRRDFQNAALVSLVENVATKKDLAAIAAKVNPDVDEKELAAQLLAAGGLKITVEVAK